MKDAIDLSPLFVGAELAAKAFLKVEKPAHYVYELRRPNGEPFYIGEGVGMRVFKHVLVARVNHRRGEDNPHKYNTIRKIEAQGRQVVYAILSFHSSKQEAEREEGRLIAELGRACDGGPLTNIHPGRGNDLGMHPETEAKRKASLAHDPNNLSKDPETRALNELMDTVFQVRSNPLKPRSKYKGGKVRHTRGTTKSRTPKPRSIGALAVLASLSEGSIDAGTMLPRAFTYKGIDAILENGVANDLLGTKVVDVISANDPVQEQFKITKLGAQAVRGILGKPLLHNLGLVD